jgi:hypothetical protein
VKVNNSASINSEGQQFCQYEQKEQLLSLETIQTHIVNKMIKSIIIIYVRISGISKECTSLTQSHFCVCPKPGPWFPKSYILVYFVFEWFQVRVVVLFVHYVVMLTSKSLRNTLRIYQIKYWISKCLTHKQWIAPVAQYHFPLQN